MRRFFYFIYYLRELDKTKYKSFANYVARYFKVSEFTQRFSVFINSLKYNVSILEYYLFGFYSENKSHAQRLTWAGTGYMYEYQLLMNPKSSRNVLSDKPLFLEKYREFVDHQFWKKGDSIEKLQLVLDDCKEMIVLKASDGQCGRGIKIISTKELTTESLLSALEESGNDMIEEFVKQHDALNELSPSGLNTLRVVTQINKTGGVDILGIRLRITVNNSVDNLAAGNVAAPVDETTGVIFDTAVYSDIAKKPVDFHPVTGVKIVGFKIPYFKETMELVKKAALLYPENKSIGWDVAITNKGPELIEGNHDWCKLLWQLPVKKGLKNILEDYKHGRR